MDFLRAGANFDVITSPRKCGIEVSVPKPQPAGAGLDRERVPFLRLVGRATGENFRPPLCALRQLPKQFGHLGAAQSSARPFPRRYDALLLIAPSK